MKRVLLIAIIFITYSLICNAQEKRIISLSEAQNIALENSYKKKSADYDLEIAKKRVWETISSGLPQISAKADYTKNLNIPVSLLPAEMFGGEKGEDAEVKFGKDFSGSWGISVTQKIFDGSYIVGTQAAKVFVELTKNKNSKTNIDIKESINSIYYTTLLIKEQQKIFYENIEINRKTLRETQALYDNGFKEQLEVEQIKLMLKKTENQLSDSKRQISNSKLLLNFTMGLDLDTDIVLSDNLDDLINPILLQTKYISSANLDDHIDIISMQTQLKAQKLTIKNEYAKFLPKIDAFYSYGKNTSYNSANIYKSQVPWFKTSMLGVKADIQIFTGFKRIVTVQKENINFKKLEIENNMLRESLKLEEKKSTAELTNAKEKYFNNVESLVISKKIYDQTRIKFKEGISTSTELAQIEQQYLNTNSELINSILILLNAKTSLDKSQGTL